MRDGEVSADPWNLSSMGSAEASPPRTKRMVMTDRIRFRSIRGECERAFRKGPDKSRNDFSA